MSCKLERYMLLWTRLVCVLFEQPSDKSRAWGFDDHSFGALDSEPEGRHFLMHIALIDYERSASSFASSLAWREGVTY